MRPGNLPLFPALWLLALSTEEELSFRQDLKRIHEEMHMPNLSPYDRIVWEEGRDQGRLAALQDVLIEQTALRFGPKGVLLQSRIQAMQDEAQLRHLARSVLTAASLEEFAGTVPG